VLRPEGSAKRSFQRRLVAVAGACTFALAAPPVGARLLEEPPKLVNFKLDDPSFARLTLLQSFHEAAVERPGAVKRYLSSPWGRWGQEPWWKLAWMRDRSEEPPEPRAFESPALTALGPAAPADRLFGFEPMRAAIEAPLGADPVQAVAGSGPEAWPTWLQRLSPGWSPPSFDSTGASFASNGFDALWSLLPLKPAPNWKCRRRPVRFVRYGGESDSFALVRCDGSVAPEALDRMTLIARLPEAARPGELLPDDPDPEAVARGEWAPGVRVVHPRLLWALQRISDAFPWKTIYVFSGYRPRKTNEKAGSHHSLHSDARAMDIHILGVPNASLFQLCRTLDDVGCGFYPNSKFVHVDVRKPATGRAFWVDISGPGEPSHYVDSWPGVVESGALVWDKAGAAAQRAPTEASCTQRP
jgi:hypothetical protein